MRWGRWVGGLLAVGAVAGGATAVWLEADEPGSPGVPGSTTQALTPVLSVRRLPSVVSRPIAARRLRVDLDALAAYLPPDACLVVAGPDGLRYEHQPNLPLRPASATKLLTATGALLALGPDSRLRTTVVAGAPPSGGVVDGDVVLVGGGDPLLASADYLARFERQPQTFTDLDALAAAVQAAGVRQVAGSVVGDDARYDAQRYVAGWPARYRDQNAVGPLSALSVNDGFERYPGSVSDDGPLAPAPDPAQSAAAVFTRLLEARGIDVVGPPRSGLAPVPAVELAAVDSPPLRAVVGQMLLESDNNTAELLLKEIGRAIADDGATAAGAAAVVARLASEGVDLGATEVTDGSGLSLDNRTTCSALVELIDRPETGPVLVEELPVAGRSGTLSERFQAPPLVGVVRAKTGSLTSVAALAGVVADDDPALTFALLVNVPPPAAVPDGVTALQQSVAEVLAGWPRGPDLDALGPLEQDR